MKRTVFLMIFSILLAACSSTSPTSVIEPTATPAGTIVLSGGGVAIRIPDRYISGNQETVDAVLEKLKTMGSSYEGAVQSLTNNRDVYLVYAFDSELGTNNTISNMNITSVDVPEDTKLEDEIQSLIGSYTDAGATDIESNPCQHNDNDCIELEATMTVGDIDMKVLQYLVKQGSKVYIVTFATEVSDFPQKYTEFDEAFSTFQILD